MIIFKKADQLSDYIHSQKKEGKSIGFVPTMGALHKGHLSLIESAKKTNDLVVCSIFVNPTQFNNPEDFKHYPIAVERDIEQLVAIHCDILFLPPVSEVYPPGHVKKNYSLGKIATILEGHHRPGHFQGVCEVVDRLLEIVQPHQLYLGQKDFQQCMVIKKLLEITGKDEEVQLIISPTIREEDGLAMSSRNLRLSTEQRKLAPLIFKELNFIKNHIHEHTIDQLKKEAEEHLSQQGFTVDYVEIADVIDLSAATPATRKMVALAAAATGNIRLIDNLVLN